MNYVLDTNVVLFYLKGNKTKKFIEEQFGPFKRGNTANSPHNDPGQGWGFFTRKLMGRWGCPD